MNRTWIFVAAALCPVVAFGQTGPSGASASNGQQRPYQPAVPAPSVVNAYGGWPGSSGGGTVAGSAMNGMANVISAKGDYNLSTSAAAVNMTQAQKNEIQNRQQWTNTFFEMRATNRQARAAERGPRLTMEQLVTISRQGVPKVLNASQFDSVSGKLVWPSALQQDSFADQRSEVEAIFATWSRYGGLDYADQTKIRQTVDAMFDELKSQIQTIPPQDYVACRRFLQSLNYTATKTELD